MLDLCGQLNNSTQPLLTECHIVVPSGIQSTGRRGSNLQNEKGWRSNNPSHHGWILLITKPKTAYSILQTVFNQSCFFPQELELNGRRHQRLHWKSYTVVSRYVSGAGPEHRSDFDVNNFNTFPLLHFSPVKSYVTDAQRGLDWKTHDVRRITTKKNSINYTSYYVTNILDYLKRNNQEKICYKTSFESYFADTVEKHVTSRIF